MLLKVTEVAERLRVSRPYIYKLLRDDKSFPRPIHIGERSPRFREDQIEAWLQEQFEQTAA